MEVNGQIHAAIYLRIVPRHPVSKLMGGPHSQYGHFGEEKNLLPLPGIQSRIIQPIA